MMNWHKEVMQNLDRQWTVFMEELERSLDRLDEQLTQTAEMTDACTDEWCQATEHVLDDLTNYIFSIHEPRNADPEFSRRIKELRRRARDLYHKYRTVSQRPAMA